MLSAIGKSTSGNVGITIALFRGNNPEQLKIIPLLFRFLGTFSMSLLSDRYKHQFKEDKR
jgi:hypothetical protein